MNQNDAIRDARQLGLPKMLILGIQHLFAMFGATVLVPLLTALPPLPENSVFPASVSIILPVCIVSLTITALTGDLAWKEALPWLIGSAAGGFLAGKWGRKIPVKWLHRGLGILIVWGGIRYLW